MSIYNLVDAKFGFLLFEPRSQQTVATLHRCTTLTSSLYKEGAEDPQTRRYALN